MNTVHEYRRENLRKLIEITGGVSLLGQKLGYTNGSFLVQMAGPAPIREVSEQTARKFEAKLGLEPGYFDMPVAVPSGQQSASAMRRTKLSDSQDSVAVATAPDVDLTALIHAIGAVADKQGIQLTTGKFADVVALALVDSRDHGGAIREDIISMILKLAK